MGKALAKKKLALDQHQINWFKTRSGGDASL
jgi:hypothetical protein